jgi:hypothetical protein
MKNFFATAAFALVLAFMLGFAACKDDPAPSKKELLTSGSGLWELTAQAIIIQGQAENVFDDLDECQRDNVDSYAASGAYQMLDGDTKCDPADPSVLENGTWSIVDNRLTTTVDGTTESSEIVELTKSTMVLETELEVLGIIATIRATFTKQ